MCIHVRMRRGQKRPCLNKIIIVICLLNAGSLGETVLLWESRHFFFLMVIKVTVENESSGLEGCMTSNLWRFGVLRDCSYKHEMLITSSVEVCVDN